MEPGATEEATFALKMMAKEKAGDKDASIPTTRYVVRSQMSWKLALGN